MYIVKIAVFSAFHTNTLMYSLVARSSFGCYTGGTALTVVKLG
jgi:hypothetical protein